MAYTYLSIRGTWPTYSHTAPAAADVSHARKALDVPGLPIGVVIITNRKVKALAVGFKISRRFNILGDVAVPERIMRQAVVRGVENSL